MHGDQEQEEPKILVVEDDEDAREAMVALLQMKGYRAVPAGNGREALDYLDQAAAPDLIILDLWMPVMDGWHFRSEQIKNPRLAHIPVIVVLRSAIARMLTPTKSSLNPWMWSAC